MKNAGKTVAMLFNTEYISCKA